MVTPFPWALILPGICFSPDRVSLSFTVIHHAGRFGGRHLYQRRNAQNRSHLLN